jgi:hypothetical protein
MGEFSTFPTSNRRFALACRRSDSRLRFLAQTRQYLCRGFTSRLRQSKHNLVPCLTAGLNSSGQSLSLGPKNRAVSSKFILRANPFRFVGYLGLGSFSADWHFCLSRLSRPIPGLFFGGGTPRGPTIPLKKNAVLDWKRV